MAANGWYPDPSGVRGRFRYWDGSTWSEETTTDPATPPPKAAAPVTTGGAKNLTWLIALGVLLVITAVVVALAVHGAGGLGGGVHQAQEDTDSSTPTVPAWDETSTPTPPPPIQSGGQLVSCPITNAYGNTNQVNGKLTADTLQVDTIDGWQLDSMWLAPIYDLHAQTDDVYPGWMSNIAVGLLSNSDGFTEIATSAEQLMECFASSGYYVDFTGRQDIIPGEQISVSGHAAWRIESDIYVSGQQVQGDVCDIIVVDLGENKDHLGIFFSSYSIGDTDRGAKVDAAIASLAVTG